MLDIHRQEFPALANKTYFNYGGQGPLPRSALAAIQQAYEYVDQAGPFSSKANVWLSQEAELTRAAIANELKVAAETITLTENVTVGCNIVLWGINWQLGDHLLLSDCEHPGVIAIIQELQRRYQLEVSTCPILATLNGEDPVSCLVKHLRPNTRLVLVSHILWNTGQVLPLAKIVAACHQQCTTRRPVQILVDAAQSVGVLPLNLADLDVDFYAFTGHKWWCGPAGVGGLYIKPEVLRDDTSDCLHPTFIGWRGIVTHSSGNPMGWRPDGRRFEVATSAIPLYAGLRAAIALHHQWGTAQDRYQQICQLSNLLWQRLSELETVSCLRTIAPPEAGLVSFQLKQQPTPQAHQQLVDTLETQQILVRTLPNPSCIRACVHYLTQPAEIEQLVQAIAAFA